MTKNTMSIVIIISWVLIILGLISLFTFIIGKSVGLINTPTWVNYVPHASGALLLFGIFLQGGKVLQRIDDIEWDVEKIDGQVGKLVTDVTAIKTKVDAHAVHIEKMDDRMHEISKK